MSSNPDKNSEKMVSTMFPEYILRYGAIGVMAVWLFTLTSRMDDVEKRLYDCMEKRAIPTVSVQNKTTNALISEFKSAYCLRPEELVIKTKKK